VLRGFVFGLSSGGLQGELVFQRGRLSDMVADLWFDVAAAGVVIRSQIAEAGGGVRKQLPDNDQNGAGDCYEGFEFAAAFDQAPIAFTQEVSVLAAATAASPSTPLRYGLPLPVLPPRVTGPD
jgi:hypothetical protein